MRIENENSGSSDSGRSKIGTPYSGAWGNTFIILPPMHILYTIIGKISK